MRPAWRRTTMTWLALLALACQLIASLLHGPHSHSHTDGKAALNQSAKAPAADRSVPPDPGDNDRDCELCAMLAAAGLIVLGLTAALLFTVQFRTAIVCCSPVLARPQDSARRPRARAPPSLPCSGLKLQKSCLR